MTLENIRFKEGDKVTPTVWKKFECGAGARWTSAHEDYEGKVCCFSGCNCGTLVELAGETSDVNEAADWFRRPMIAATAESKAFEAMFDEKGSDR